MYRKLALALYLLFSSSILLGAERSFYAKVEPYERYEIKAAVAGRVVLVRKGLEGSLVRGKREIIKIDDSLEKELLKADQERLAITKDRVNALQEIARLRKERSIDIQSIETKAKLEKENESINALNAQVNYLQALEQFFSLEAQIAQRLDNLEKKSITAENRYIYKIYVSEGDYVNLGSKLMEVMDISKGRLTFFVSAQEAESITQKVFYLSDVRRRDVKIEKVYRVADSEYVSEYRVEVVIPSVKTFSELVKIDLKDQ